MKLFSEEGSKTVNIIGDIFIFIVAVFCFNFFLDCLNANDWFLFAIGVLGIITDVIVIFAVIIRPLFYTYKKFTESNGKSYKFRETQ